MLAKSLNTGLDVLVPEFEWNEPEGCSSPRGWCRLRPESHVDREQYHFDYFTDYCGGLNVGNYLDYGPPSYPGKYGPNGETVHWVAFYRHCNPITGAPSDVRLGYGWARTIAEAKAMIEGNIRAYFGLPRD